MTPKEIIEMAQKCRLIAMRPHLDGIYSAALVAFAKLVAEKALAEHAMRETQRLGQEIEQEPVALHCCGYTDASAVKWNPFNRIVQCHNCGQTYTPPQRTEQEPVAMRMPKVGDEVVCIEDDSLGVVAYLTAGGSPEIKFDDGSHGTYLLREFAELFRYATPPQRTWVGLTDDEQQQTYEQWQNDGWGVFYSAIEAKLKEKNK